jgi:hypothetical protein
MFPIWFGDTSSLQKLSINFIIVIFVIAFVASEFCEFKVIGNMLTHASMVRFYDAVGIFHQPKQFDDATNCGEESKNRTSSGSHSTAAFTPLHIILLQFILLQFVLLQIIRLQFALLLFVPLQIILRQFVLL